MNISINNYNFWFQLEYRIRNKFMNHDKKYIVLSMYDSLYKLNIVHKKG